MSDVPLEFAFFETLFHAAPIAVGLVDAELRFVRVNEPLAELTGVPAAEHPGRFVLDVMPRHNEQIVRDMRRVLATGEPLVGADVSGETPRAPGVQRTFRRSYYPVRVADGRIVGVVAIVEELTEARRTAAALRDTTERLRAVFEQSPVSTVVYDAPSGVPIQLNPAFTRLWGLTIADVPPGYTVFDDRQLQDAGVIPLVRRAFAGETVSLPPISYDFRKVVGRGGALWTQAHLYPLRDESGAVTQVVLSHEDVTARLRAEAALVAARREAESARDGAERARRQTEEALRAAEAANLAKAQFLGTMSHELRTPLNAIAGYVDLLELGIRGPVTDEQHGDLARIRRSAQVLMALVTDILNFARLEAGQVEFRDEHVRLDEVAGDIETLIEPQVRARGLTYRCGPDDDGDEAATLTVRADGERLKQVLLNLLTNAVKFTETGGRVELAWASGGDDAVRIQVRDTGRGIPTERLDQIFQPFVQVDRHLTKTSQQGVGLGLAISRDLARRMGGDLTVQSEPGQGSTFTLTLPRARTRT